MCVNKVRMARSSNKDAPRPLRFLFEMRYLTFTLRPIKISVYDALIEFQVRSNNRFKRSVYNYYDDDKAKNPKIMSFFIIARSLC